MTTVVSNSNPLAPGNAIQVVAIPANALGSDGGIPIYNPSLGFKIWSEDQIFNGGPATNKYIPNLNDIVILFTNNQMTFTKVIGYNSDMTSIVQEQTLGSDPTSFSPNDIFTGIGPGAPSDIYRVYVDSSVNPKRVNIDAMLTVSGTECRSFKLYKGSTVGSQGTVVSMRYNGSGSYVDDAVAMKPLQQNNSTTTLWGFPEFHTNHILADGEVLTLVIYTDTGSVYHHRQLMVQNTDYFRTTDYSKKAIDHIALETVFMGVNDNIIHYPINVTAGSVNMTCVVTYKDGTTQNVSIDGSRAKIFGFSEYQATYTGQQFEVALQYVIGANESYIGDGLNVDGTVITRVYQAVTSAQPGNYNYRLYCQPVFNMLATRYDLKWWLHNLDRNVSYDATGVVTVNEGLTPYDGTLFGSKQTLNVSVDVEDVNGSLAAYRHTQSLAVTLYGSPATHDTPFGVAYDINQSSLYGDRTYATISNNGSGNTIVNIAPGLSNLNDWIDRMYTRLRPSFDNSIEPNAPTPTHVIVKYDATNTVTVPIVNQNLSLTLSGNITNWSGKSLILTFIKDIGSGNAIQYLATGVVYMR